MLVFPISHFASSGGYVANAVNFDGTNDYLTRGADLTGSADGREGLFSCWVSFNGGDGVQQTILRNTGAFFQIDRDSNNKIRVIGSPADLSPSIVLNVSSASSYIVSAGWTHILTSWNLNVPIAHLFVNDIDDESIGSIENSSDNINYTQTDWAVGGREDGGVKLNGDMADCYLDIGTSLDLSIDSNRRKFISSTGKPVDLGHDGSVPTGSQPIIFLSGATATWHANAGSGGGFNENGAIADATSSPSD